MGQTENAKVKIEIKGGNGQVNVATDNSTINAVNNVNMSANDIKGIMELADKFIELLKVDATIDTDIKENLVDEIEVVKEQLTSETPKLPRLRKALQSIGGVQGALTKGTTIMLTLNSFMGQVDKFIEGMKVLG